MAYGSVRAERMNDLRQASFVCQENSHSLRCRALIRRHRIILSLILAAVAVTAGWIYWNRPRQSDMAAYVPAECLAFIEANSLGAVADQIEHTQAWKALAGPIGARTNLLPNRWLIRFARWTGLGSTDSVLLARSQFAVVFADAQANQGGTTLTIKPLAALVIETHTMQRRMRPVLERRVDEFARRVYRQPTRLQKQVNGIDLIEWSSSDGARHIIMTFVDTVAIVSNDESLVLRCVEVRRGKLPSLAANQQLNNLREKVGAANASVFGFIPKSGIKPILQAWVLSHAGASADGLTVARFFADTFGNLIDGLGWSSRFADGATEDHCLVSLSQGVADQIRSSVVPEGNATDKCLAFVPPDAYSVSVYHFRDVDGFWRDLNAAVSSHADALAAIASRPYLRSLVKAYGIEDPDAFARAVGPQLATVRLDNTSPSVLMAEAFDRPTLRKLAQQRLGASAKTETVGDAELLLSSSDTWAASFADNYFLIGPERAIRLCLQARAQSTSLTSLDQFRGAQRLIDVSLPISTASFTDDHHAAISFVELFSHSERPTFSANGAAVDNASRSLPYAVTVTLLKEQGFDWTSRSSFGLLGSLLVSFAPENSQ